MCSSRLVQWYIIKGLSKPIKSLFILGTKWNLMKNFMEMWLITCCCGSEKHYRTPHKLCFTLGIGGTKDKSVNLFG